MFRSRSCRREKANNVRSLGYLQYENEYCKFARCSCTNIELLLVARVECYNNWVQDKSSGSCSAIILSVLHSTTKVTSDDRLVKW